MGTSLTGVNISSSYLGLLKSTDSLAISTSAKRITDGAGNDLPIKLSTNQMLFNAGTASAPALSFDGNLSEGFFLPTDENIGVAIAGSEVARFLSTGLSLTSSKLTLSNDQKVRWTSDDVYIQGTTASDNIQLGVGGSTQFTFAQTTGMRLHQYGSGNITGTVTQRLGVTSAGQVVEIPIGAGALDGSGTAGKIAKFTDSDTLGDSVISESSGNIQIQGLLGVGLVPESAVQLSVNGQIGTSNNGNAGAPDFTFYGDDNTGMFRADADTLAFSTGGTERLRVNSTGLGIGTTSPASKAHVAFTADFDGLRIQNSTRGHNYLLSTAGTSAEVFSIYDLDNSNNLAQFGNSGISLYTGGTERLNINSSGDATFAGNVTINKASNPTSLQIGSSLADDPFIVFQTDGNTMSMGIDRSDSNKFVISDNATLGTNNRLTIDTSGNSTFAGDVTISGSGDKIISAISSDDDATLFLSGAGSGKDTHIVYGGDRDLFISKSSSATATSEGTPVLTLGSNSNATFAGDVTISKDIPAIDLVDTNSDDDFRIRNNNGTFEIFDITNTGARFQVNSDGNSIVTGSLGIGATPSEDLHITGDTPVIRLTDSDTSRDAQIVAVDGNLRFDTDNNNQQSDTNISFRTDGSEHMRLISSGEILKGITSAVGVGGTPADANSTEIGNGYIILSRDDTADAKQISFGKNGAEHSFLQTTSSGLTIGGANVTFAGDIFGNDRLYLGTKMALDVNGTDLFVGSTTSADHNDTVNIRTNDDNRVIITDTSSSFTNSVGIGTTSPANGKLQIDNSTNQISIETGTAGDGRLHIGHFSNGTFIGTYGDDGGVADLLRFGVHSGDTALTINSDLSATFAGNVTLENASSPTVRLKDTTNNCEVFLYAQNSNAHVGTQSNHNFIIDTNNSTAITIDTSQNVGIGTSSPSAKLEISHTDTMIRMSDSDGTNQYLELGHNNGSSTYVSRNNTSMGTHVFYTANGTSTTERLRISSTGTTTIKTDGTTQLILNRVDSSIFADNTIGTIQATADDPSAGQLGGQIQFTGGGTWSSNNYPTNIIFSNDSSGTLTERMRITSAGDVALYETLQFFDDTSTPSASAFVHRPASNTLAFGTNSSERLKIDSSGGVIFKGALADHQTNAGAFEYFSNQFKMRAYGASTGTGFLTFDTGGGGGGASSERARIDSSGNLGLGTTNATPSNGGGMCINGGSITRIDLRNSTTGDTTGDGTSLQLNGNDFTIENRESGYVAISTSLTERMRITTTGEITLSNSDGIRLSPQNSNLYSTDGALSYYGTDNAVYLNGAGANGWLRLQGSGAENNRNAINIFSSGYALADTIEFITASSTRAIIDSSGRLGLGTTSPDARFSVVTGTANSTASRIGGLEYSGTQRGLTIKTFQSNGGDDCGVEFNAGEGLSGYGSFIFKADTSERARITSGGAFLVGKTAQGLSTGGNELDSGLVRATRADAHVAEFNRLSSDGSIVNFYRQTSQVGSISVTTSATAFNTSSDYRLKEDLKDFNALDIASKIKMYDFKWKAGDSRSYGVMAHELQEVVPQAVSGDKDAEDMQQVDYSKLVPILLKSIQELEARVKELEKEI